MSFFKRSVTTKLSGVDPLPSAKNWQILLKMFFVSFKIFNVISKTIEHNPGVIASLNMRHLSLKRRAVERFRTDAADAWSLPMLAGASKCSTSS